MAARKKNTKKKASKGPAKKATARKRGVSPAGNDRPQKRVKVSQTDFPQITLEKALRIAQALWNEFAGTSAAPHDIAFAIDMAPTSGSWRNLCGSSIAYGLTEGGYNAQEISLTDLGRRIVAPEEEDDDVKARAEAVQQPRIIREFIQKYNRAKFPSDAIAANVLVSMGLPKERAAGAAELLKEVGKAAGIIRDTKTGLFVAADTPVRVEPEASAEDDDQHEDDASDSEGEDPADTGSPENADPAPEAEKNDNVFISHGKNRAIVQQLKELLTFGKLSPLVSVEKESTAIPVPEKVFEDMRKCSAGVIHVTSEGELLDAEGKPHTQVNENVLIEIGAAIALYRKRVILLVEKGLKLPSNLQGLYRCEYEGDKLDYEATMKLLKTFNEFR